MKLRKYRMFWDELYEGGGKRNGERVVKTCVKHFSMKEKESEDIGTPHRLKRRKGIVILGLFRINFSFTLLRISLYSGNFTSIIFILICFYMYSKSRVHILFKVTLIKC